LSEEAPDPRPESEQAGSRAVILAVAAAAAVLVIVLLLAFRGEGAPSFPGGDAVAAVVRASHVHEAGAFGPAGPTIADSGDGLLAAGFEGFRVPEGLGGATVRGALVDKTGAAPVAVLRLGDGGLRAAVFAETTFGVGLPDAEEWIVYELPPAEGAARLGVALQAENGVCFAVSSPEGTAAVRRWLASQGVKTE